MALAWHYRGGKWARLTSKKRFAKMQKILIPAAVDDELMRLVDDWAAARPAWLVRRALDPAAAPASWPKP